MLPSSKPYVADKQPLRDPGTHLTSFYFRYGANFYAFSYQKQGETRHTLIDSGDSDYEDRILAILTENGIDPGRIERIIITHSHHDHCGLAAMLAGQSGAQVLAHSSFRNSVEGRISEQERRWLGKFDPTRLRDCKMVYLAPSAEKGSVTIAGVDFPVMLEPVEIGTNGRLTVLTCPQSERMHSPDQLLALYSTGDPRTTSGDLNRDGNASRPTDNILFSGDLWLMHGPLFDRGFGHVMRHLRFGFHNAKALMSGKGTIRRDPREQDPEAKEALKTGFSLITVKPGHGREFLGSRILPKSFHADRDLLVELGYPMDASKATLKSPELAPKVADIREAGYAAFIEEVSLWEKMGYSFAEISDLLIRIYREQEGGGHLVEQDRKERRARIEGILGRLQRDQDASQQLRGFAASTLSKIESEFRT